LALAVGLLGGIALVAATALGARPRRPGESFAWIVIAGLGYGMLGIAAAVKAPASGGLRAAVVQLAAVVLAAALGSLSASRSAESTPSPGSGALSAAGQWLAWLTLVGLPPTIGFHGKLLIYRALLAAAWNPLAALALAGSAAALLIALWAIRSRPAERVPLRGIKAVVTVALILLVLGLGVYPRLILLPARAAGVAAPTAW